MMLDSHALKLVFAIVLLVLMLLAVHTLRTWSKASTNTIELTDLITENGRMSKVAVILMGAFGVHSWMIVYLTLDGKITEGYATTYGAIWVTPLLVKLWQSATPPTPPTGDSK